MKLEHALDLQAHLDGQLDPGRSAEVERSLRDDSEAAMLARELSAIREAVRAHEPAGAVPESREFYFAQIQRRIAAEERAAARTGSRGPFLAWLRWLAPVMGVAALVLVVSRTFTGSATPPVASANVLTFHSDSDRMTIHWIN